MSRKRQTALLAAATVVVSVAAFNYRLIAQWGLRKFPAPRLPLDNSSHAVVSADVGMRPTYADLAYAEKSSFEKLDLYLPPTKGGPAPVVVWIHGGGLVAGDKKSMPRQIRGTSSKFVISAFRHLGLPPPFEIPVPDVAALTEKGYAVVSLNYRLIYKPGDHYFRAAIAALQDGKSAVRFLRANAAKYNLDPKRIAVWGNSAGGYIASMLGVTGDQRTPFDDPAMPNAGVSSAVQAVVVWYGAADAEALRPEIRLYSYIPTAKVLPPFLIANGDADPDMPVHNAKKLHDALLGAGGHSTLTIIPGAEHEDPVFMTTQMAPTFLFLDRALGL